jgi:hypothetical protein
MTPRADSDDPRLAFVYAEAVRGLEHQQGVLDSLIARAGMLVYATSFASGLLGGAALSDGLGAWDWAGVGLLFAIGALLAFMMWPYHKYWFRFDVADLLREFVDSHPQMTMSAMHRALALRIKADMANNWRSIRRIRWAGQAAIVLLLFQILAWLFAIAGL